MLLDLEWEALGRAVRTRDLEATVHVEDRVVVAVRMLPVLAGDAMATTLHEVLAEQGWEAQPDGSLSRSFGGVTASLDAGATAVTLTLAGEVTVKATGVARLVGSDPTSETDAAAEATARAQRSLAERSTKAKVALEAENAAAMSRDEPAVRAALQEALNRVYRRALEARARQLGELESIDERGDVRGGYEVTVVVKA